jgi:hypothetical protein
MGDPTSSYATAGIALRVIGMLKPPHHDKVETPRGGIVSKASYINLLHMSAKRPSSGAVNIKYVKEGMIKYGEACLLYK